MNMNERHLERQLRQAEADAESARNEYQRLLARNQQDRDDRAREAQEQRGREMRSASTWPEAFRKNLYLLGCERSQCISSEKDDAEYQRDVQEQRDWWQREIDQVKRAQELWAAGWPAVEAAMEALRTNVADALQADQVEHGDQRGGDLIKALREDDIDAYLNW